MSSINLDYLKPFINIIDENYETLYTIVIYNKSVNFLLNDISKQKDDSKNITNSFKKNKICSRLYAFENYLINNYVNMEIENISGIFLIDDNIHKFNLTDEMIKIAIEYGLRTYFIKIDKFFHIEYLIDFFTNFTFIYKIKLTKSNLTLIKLNKNKEKELLTSSKTSVNDINELSKKLRSDTGYKDIIFITGARILEGYIGNIICKSDNLSKNDVWGIYEDEQMKINLMELEKRMRDISNPKYMDLYVFGKLKIEIKEAMECYQLKELFIEEKKLEKLKEFVEPEYFNFKVYSIRSLESGDIGSDFIKSYNGIMGIKYF